ncbi:DUF1793-domain-containing protein [Schizopora paradoxa]|uniref:DUF1793-domain-containing protein n=1 Tax=Schizopora paradoxa TaxID=27342 RepID=A0A0H2RF36_9AGAM|nr:DUF1793-domain-containing protein [Schizopora paradoxa]
MNIVLFYTIFIPGAFVIAQLHAPSWPLAVKNPYVNGWYGAGPGALPLNNVVVTMWNSLHTPWYCTIVVDGIPYRAMDHDTDPISNTSNQSSVVITPTSTTVRGQAGPVAFTFDFLSPIIPFDLVRQSLPYSSYFAVSVEPLDDSNHSVTIFSNFGAEWVSGDDSLFASAGGGIRSDFVFVQAAAKTFQPFVEINDRAQDSTIIYAVEKIGDVTYEVGPTDSVRIPGTNGTGLGNKIDSDVGTHAIDKGVDSISHTMRLAFLLIWAKLVPQQVSCGQSECLEILQMDVSTTEDEVSFFLDDFEYASNASAQLDKEIMSDTSGISQEYSDLISLTARSAMSALEITVSKNADGSYNTSDIMAFMKDIGNVGSGGVNSVDVLYASFPAYLFLNPAIGGYLLRPLLLAQDTPQYTQPYAAQNLDTHFPNATSLNVPHNFGIEQSGNMIIMLLAHLLASNDDTLVTQYYGIIKNWTDYLVENSLSPGKQQTSQSDGTTLSNQTNLALKGIIGIGAMAKISSQLNKTDDATIYNNKSKSYIEQWQNASISRDGTRILSSFENENSTGLVYNLYADRLLGLGLVPQSVYDIQSAYIKSQLASNNIGIPLSSDNPTLARADWLMFVAASTDDNTLRNSLVSMIHQFVFNPTTSVPISPVYNPINGSVSNLGANSPSMGAMFAILAMNKTVPNSLSGGLPVSSPGPTDISSTLHQKDQKIEIGSICAGILTAIMGGVWFCIYRRKKERKSISGSSASTSNREATADENAQNTSAAESPVRYELLASSSITTGQEFPFPTQDNELDPPPAYKEFP